MFCIPSERASEQPVRSVCPNVFVVVVVTVAIVATAEWQSLE